MSVGVSQLRADVLNTSPFPARAISVTITELTFKIEENLSARARLDESVVTLQRHAGLGLKRVRGQSRLDTFDLSIPASVRS